MSLIKEYKTPNFSSVLDALTSIYMNTIGGSGTWGSSPVLPTVKAVVFETITAVGVTVYTIPPSVTWTAEVITGDGVTSGANNMDQYEVAHGTTRVDGQAHLGLSFNIPDGVVIRFNYQPA